MTDSMRKNMLPPGTHTDSIFQSEVNRIASMSNKEVARTLRSLGVEPFASLPEGFRELVYGSRFQNKKPTPSVDAPLTGLGLGSYRESSTEVCRKESFDVLVIGCGPAGSFVAERLAQAGKRVAVLHEGSDMKPKACGGGVTSKALKAWPHLIQAVGRVVEELEMYAPSGRKLHLTLKEPFAIYSELAFNCYLLDRARVTGVQVLAEKTLGWKVSRTKGGWLLKGSNGEERFGNVLIGTEGPDNVISKMLSGSITSLETEMVFGYRAPLPVDRQAQVAIAFLPGWSGYAWAFPRFDHIMFGIASSRNAFEQESLDNLLWDFMVGYYRHDKRETGFWPSLTTPCERDKRIRKQLEDSAERYVIHVPRYVTGVCDNRRTCGEDWALLGDAAGFADPVTGEGIYYALRSAELCAEAYLHDELLDYERQWREDFGMELKRASQMRRRFYGNFLGTPFIERMIELACDHPSINRVLGNLIVGQKDRTNITKQLARVALLPRTSFARNGA